MNTIATQFGEVTLLEPPPELLQAIRAFLPFGLIHNVPPEAGADYGLVMQCAGLELFGVRQQAEALPYLVSTRAQEDNNILIAHSLAGYLKAGYGGLFLPCTYFTPNQRPLFESGIAYFGYPSASGRECQETARAGAFDEQFGRGFTAMLTGFMHALRQSSVDTKLPLPPPVGLNVRYRHQLGYLEFDYMVVGSQVVCLKTVLAPETDLTWTALRETGITTVFHLPCQPAVINDPAQMPLAKPAGAGEVGRQPTHRPSAPPPPATAP